MYGMMLSKLLQAIAEVILSEEKTLLVEGD